MGGNARVARSDSGPRAAEVRGPRFRVRRLTPCVPFVGSASGRSLLVALSCSELFEGSKSVVRFFDLKRMSRAPQIANSRQGSGGVGFSATWSLAETCDLRKGDSRRCTSHPVCEVAIEALMLPATPSRISPERRTKSRVAGIPKHRPKASLRNLTSETTFDVTAAAFHDDIVGPLDAKLVRTICGPKQCVDGRHSQDLGCEDHGAEQCSCPTECSVSQHSSKDKETMPSKAYAPWSRWGHSS